MGFSTTRHNLRGDQTMTRNPTPVETVKASEARQHFSELVNRVHETGERIMIEKNGAAVVGLVSAQDMRRLQLLDEQRDRESAALDRIRAGFRGVPGDEMEREVSNAIAETRREARVANESQQLVKR